MHWFLIIFSTLLLIMGVIILEIRALCRASRLKEEHRFFRSRTTLNLRGSKHPNAQRIKGT